MLVERPDAKAYSPDTGEINHVPDTHRPMNTPSRLKETARRWTKRIAGAIADNEIEHELRKSNAARPLPTAAQETWETAIDTMKIAHRAIIAGVITTFTTVLLSCIKVFYIAGNGGDPEHGANVAVATLTSALAGSALIVAGSCGARNGDPWVQTAGLALVSAAGGAGLYYLLWGG